MDEQNLGILERIHASYFQLTAAERKVADYILAQHIHVQFMSISQLADECGVAEATISRFCRSLKLKGFNAFKLELARYSTSGINTKKRTFSTDTPAGRVQEISQVATDAVQQTIDLVKLHEVQRAVELIENAGRVLCIGAGGSMIMAQEFAHLFSMVIGKVHAVSGSHMQVTAIATMDRNDVIVMFSYSGATQSGLDILELARNRGLKTILITRFDKSPASKLADVVLCCGSNEGPFQFGSVPAKIAQLVVMDVLFQEYCYRNTESSTNNIQSIASALSGMHL